jgi:hypothetical protein
MSPEELATAAIAFCALTRRHRRCRAVTCCASVTRRCDDARSRADGAILLMRWVRRVRRLSCGTWGKAT